MATPILSIRNLTRAYADRVALNDLSLDIEPHEIFAFLGPNGSGKTTLFRILSTLIPPTSGTVTYHFGPASIALEPSALASIRPHLGVVFQSPSIDSQLTAAENLRHHGHLYGLRGGELQSRITQMLERVSLLDRQHDRVGSFSGGMRRRVEIAKGLLTSPSLLLLDEPSTGLDPGARIDLWTQLKRIQSEGVTILLTTHLMEEADQCTRLAVMDQGKLIACDTPAQLKSQVGGDVVTLATHHPDAVTQVLREQFSLTPERVGHTLRIEHPSGGDLIPPLLKALPDLVDSVSVGKPTLLDVFVHLTGHHFDTGGAPALLSRR